MTKTVCMTAEEIRRTENVDAAFERARKSEPIPVPVGGQRVATGFAAFRDHISASGGSKLSTAKKIRVGKLERVAACLLIVFAVSFQAAANSPAWERLLEPTEPDTEAIARAAEAAAAPPVEAAPEPVLTEQEKKAQAQQEAKDAKAAQDAQRRADRETRAAEKRQAREERAAQKRAAREARNAQRNADREAETAQKTAEREAKEAEKAERSGASVTAVPPPEESEQQLPHGVDYDIFADHAPLQPLPSQSEPVKPKEPAPPAPVAETAKPAEPPPPPPPPAPVAEPAKPAEPPPPPPPAPVAETAKPAEPPPPPAPVAEPAKPAEPPPPPPAPVAEPAKPAEPPPPPPAPVAEAAKPEESTPPPVAETAAPEDSVRADEVAEPGDPIDVDVVQSPPPPADARPRPAPRPPMERSKAPPKGETAPPRAAKAPKEPKPSMPGQFGVRAGLGVGGFGGHNGIKELDVPVGGDRDTIKLGMGVSATLGLVYTKPISENLSVSGELQYTLYTAYGECKSDTTSSNFKPLNEASLELHSIELPVMLRLNVGESAYLEFGPQFGVNVYARLDVNASAYKANLQGFAFGPTFGAGITVNCVSVGLRAHIGVIEYVENAGGKPWSLQLSATSGF